jgi:hypothetical protein
MMALRSRMCDWAILSGIVLVLLFKNKRYNRTLQLNLKDKHKK